MSDPMNESAKTTIWSLRWNPARGNHWVSERKCECSYYDLHAWLKIFRDDEPGVTFLASPRKPPIG